MRIALLSSRPFIAQATPRKTHKPHQHMLSVYRETHLPKRLDKHVLSSPVHSTPSFDRFLDITTTSSSFVDTRTYRADNSRLSLLGELDAQDKMSETDCTALAKTQTRITSDRHLHPSIFSHALAASSLSA